jgi:chromosome segregation ATPase
MDEATRRAKAAEDECARLTAAEAARVAELDAYKRDAAATLRRSLEGHVTDLAKLEAARVLAARARTAAEAQGRDLAAKLANVTAQLQDARRQEGDDDAASDARAADAALRQAVAREATAVEATAQLRDALRDACAAKGALELELGSLRVDSEVADAKNSAQSAAALRDRAAENTVLAAQVAALQKEVDALRAEQVNLIHRASVARAAASKAADAANEAATKVQKANGATQRDLQRKADAETMAAAASAVEAGTAKTALTKANAQLRGLQTELDGYRAAQLPADAARTTEHAKRTQVEAQLQAVSSERDAALAAAASLKDAATQRTAQHRAAIRPLEAERDGLRSADRGTEEAGEDEHLRRFQEAADRISALQAEVRALGSANGEASGRVAAYEATCGSLSAALKNVSLEKNGSDVRLDSAQGQLQVAQQELFTLVQAFNAAQAKHQHVEKELRSRKRFLEDITGANFVSPADSRHPRPVGRQDDAPAANGTPPPLN